MAYTPVSGSPVQYSNENNELASGYYLKFYIANTTTPVSMATDSTGGTLLAKCKLNPDGIPITNPLDDTTTFIPYIDQRFRYVIYKNEADADADTTANAFVNIPDVFPLLVSETIVTSVDSVADLAGLAGSVDGQQINLRGYQVGSTVGGGLLSYNTSLARTGHDGVRYFSPDRDRGTETQAAYNSVITNAALGVWERIDLIEITSYQAGAINSGADDIAPLDALVPVADALSIPINLAGIATNVSALWHVNLPINVHGNGAAITGGDAEGVVWFGYRTNDYFINKSFTDVHCYATTAGGTGFTSSKSINCNFETIVGDDSVGDGIRIEAAVGCTIKDVRARLTGFNGVIFTYYTNSDLTTHVPCTANTIINMTSESNGIDGSASEVNSFGIICDKDPDGNPAAYGNQFYGGFVQLNEFTGVRDFGQNEWTMWIESNGKNAGSAQQYNFWDSGPLGSIIKAGRNQGAGVLRKLFVDGAVESPVTKNVHFEGVLQTDIEYETTISGTHNSASTTSFLSDTTKAWGVNALVGKVLTNSSDGSTMTVVSNLQNTVTGTLAGGTNNDFGPGDLYSIADAGPTKIIQDHNEYSGSSPEITPTAYDQRDSVIGEKYKREFLGKLEYQINDLDLAANSSGSNQFYTLFTLDAAAQVGTLSVSVSIPGSPPTLLGVIVESNTMITGVNQYIRFTLLNTERYAAGGDSNTADVPVIRITTGGTVQYKHNNASSAHTVSASFLKKI